MRAAATRLGPLIDWRSQSAVADVLSGLEAAAAAGSSARSDQEAVDIAADAWGRRLSEKLAGESLAAGERALFGAIARDLATVRADDPFTEIFDAVTERAATLYEHNWPPTGLAMSFQPQYHGQDKYGLRAAVRAGATGPEIKLVPYLDEFGPEAYAALPCALAHECVCHVPAQQLGEVDNASLFAEGFMDWAATYWLKVWAARLPKGFAELVPRHEPYYRAALVAVPSEERTARLAGRRAAQHLSTLLQNHHGQTLERAESRVATLAVRANVFEARLRRKEEFVDGVDCESDDPLQEPLLGVLKGKRSVAELL